MEATLRKVIQQGVLPLITPKDYDICRRVIDAGIAAGMTAFELLDRDNQSLSIFRKLRAEYPGLTLLAGSVFDSSKAATFIEAGADGIVNARTAAADIQAASAGTLYIPAFGTSGELGTALAVQTGMQKYFPAKQLGTEHLAAILAPYSQQQPCIMVTGGVKLDQDFMRPFLEIEQVAVLGYSVNKYRIENQQWDDIKCELAEGLWQFERLRPK